MSAKVNVIASVHATVISVMEGKKEIERAVIWPGQAYEVTSAPDRQIVITDLEENENG